MSSAVTDRIDSFGSAVTDGGDDAFALQVDVAGAGQPLLLNLGGDAALEAQLNETAPRVFAAEWRLGEPVYERGLFAIKKCVRVGPGACADMPRYAVKLSTRRWENFPHEDCKKRLGRELAIMSALDSEYTVRLAELPYVNDGLVYMVRDGSGVGWRGLACAARRALP